MNIFQPLEKRDKYFPGTGKYTETDRSLWVWTPVHSRIYVNSPAGRIGIYQEEASSDGSGAVTRSYLHMDHIGSVVAVSDDSALPDISYYSFDAWGQRRNPDDWSPYVSGFEFQVSSFTDRGFTGHEQLDHLNLIHMNGRIYDGLIGRFITPDPTIPAPQNLQAFNRYSYVYNNPLGFIDPGGMTPEQVAAASSGVTAEELNKANRAMSDNTSAGAIGNSGLAKFDGISTVPGKGGGGGPPTLMPEYDDYGNITGFRNINTGEFTSADAFSESERARFEGYWNDFKAENPEAAWEISQQLNFDKIGFATGDTSSMFNDDGSLKLLGAEEKINVWPYIQKYEKSCVIAILRSLLDKVGVEISEDDLIKFINFNRNYDKEVIYRDEMKDIVKRLAKEHGLKFIFLEENETENWAEEIFKKT